MNQHSVCDVNISCFLNSTQLTIKRREVRTNPTIKKNLHKEITGSWAWWLRPIILDMEHWVDHGSSSARQKVAEIPILTNKV
jgi:hypothetical protein